MNLVLYLSRVRSSDLLGGSPMLLRALRTVGFHATDISPTGILTKALRRGVVVCRCATGRQPLHRPEGIVAVGVWERKVHVVSRLLNILAAVAGVLATPIP